MNDLQKILNTVFERLCEVSFFGKDAEVVADIKQLLRQAFHMAAAEEGSTDG